MNNNEVNKAMRNPMEFAYKVTNQTFALENHFSVAKIERNIHTVRTKTTDRNTNFIDRLINLSFQHPISVKKSNFVSTRRIAYE